MATQRIAKIPFSRIVKIGVWSNQTAKTTMSSIYNTLKNTYPGKEVYIINGGFFCMTSAMTPCWGVKAGGRIWSDGWSSTCFIAMNGKEIKFFPAGMNSIPINYTDGLSGYPALIENGKKSPAYHEEPDGKSDRGRSMLGYTKDHLIISCVSDVSGTSDFTLREELNFMLAQGCTYAINLDGGGSSQCNFDGLQITSSRRVNNFVYVIANYDTSNPKKAVQIWLNQTYNSGLVVDGALGNLTNKAIIKGMQRECKVTVDGSWGPKSNAAFTAIYKGSIAATNKNKVKLIQCALCRKGYWNSALTEEFDDTLKNQVILFQRANKLVPDGSVGQITIKYLFK